MNDEPPMFKGIPVRGCRFYPNACKMRNDPNGTFFTAERDKANPYDCNSILIRNEAGDEAGTVGREYAAEIAPWLDAGWHFVVWKTGRVACFMVVTLDPIRPTKAEDVAGAHQTVPGELEDA